MKKIVFGGIVGAVVLFIWTMASWAVLPWHTHAYKEFKNPEAVARIVDQNASEDGVYLFPFSSSDTEEARENLAKGPIIYAQVQKGGMDPFSPILYIVTFVNGFIGSLFLAYLLRKKGHPGYFQRVFFGAIFGLTVGILAAVPNWNWMGASGAFTLIVIADYLIAYLLVGITIAGFVKPRDF